LENSKFDKIRPYTDSEANEVLNKIAKSEGFIEIIGKIYPEPLAKYLINQLTEFKTINEFQSKVISQYINNVVMKSVEDLTYTGIENISKTGKTLFISNHRDIVLDSAFLNEILHRNGFETTEIAIGSNLLIFKWIEEIVRLNKTFIVERGLKGKEMLESSILLSEYIRTTITKNKSSIWIAQREGRTKDGNDKTQISLLKMFDYSGTKNFVENFEELNIIPVSISYEIEPCDKSKTYETYLKKIGDSYNKTEADDLQSMAKGINEKKGRVHFSFLKPISEQIKILASIKNKNERFDKLVELIDNKIYSGYSLTENNYIAADLLTNTNEYSKHYNSENKENFIEYKKSRIADLIGDTTLLDKIFCEIYANPVFNKKSTEK